ncbi:ribonuclease HI family protein [Virgibacillus halophilus]|uniref:ribonuclease HI family protein n=1 Tax=Tigheibacillus halophilus TaxID=361280 RepID=UPI00363E41D3
MIVVYTDGASKGNPGISGAGIYMKAGGESFDYTIPLETMSNHEAEFHAVIKALEICKEKFAGEILSFRSDSKTVVDIIENGSTKNVLFQPLITKINLLTKFFPYFFIKWIPEKQNAHADRLAKKAIQQQN